MDHKSRIALIAVHGVGHQQPRASAQRAADLLRNQREGYDWLGQSMVRIPVEAVSTDIRPAEISGRKKKNVLAEYVSQTLSRAILSKSSDLDEQRVEYEVPLDVKDMQERLLGYTPRGADTTYATTRIELKKTGGLECHVFELFWTDISRQQKNVIGTVVEFYQLLFFLIDLGGRAIQYARASYARGNTWWFGLDWAHKIAHLIIVLGIPILNLALLGLAIAAAVSGYVAELPVYAERLGGYFGSGYFKIIDLQEVTSALFLGGIFSSLLAVTFVSREERARASIWPWAFPALATAFLLPLILLYFSGFKGFYSVELKRWFPMIAWLTVAYCIYRLMGIYEQFRGRARCWSIVMLFVTTLIFSFQLAKRGWPSIWPEIFLACEQSISLAIEWIHRPLWIAFALFSLACLLTSVVAVCSLKPDGENIDRAKRAAATANLSLAVPGTLVLTVDLGLWQLFVWGLLKLPKNLVETDQLNSAENAFDLSVPPGTAFGLLVFVLAALFAVWLFLPAALAESRPPNNASWLGAVLSVGFRKLKYSGWTVQLLITVGLLFVGALYWMPCSPLYYRPEDGMAVVVVGGALFAIFAFRGAGEAIRIVLDIALDVANWLRHDPPLETPRARICARYASLLKYICNWHDSESNEPYDAIIVFAHSQGCVITADLFRFLTHAAEPGLRRIFHSHGESERLPVYLFTMGCPLRQLYGQRFPDEYAWAMEPKPDDLGVALWSNFYRSGDYVGRALWQPDLDQSGAYVRGSLHDGKRRERCIGAGAHTHYWDETAPEIAEELDHLIEVAAASPRGHARF